jgi:hypothetical protein
VIRTRECLSRIQVKVKGYVKENWGYPFIAGFMILLFAAAVFLAAGAGWAPLAEAAEAIAVCAYFALAAGIVLQLAYFYKNRRKNEGGILDGSS